jgi:hypothetical protein
MKKTLTKEQRKQYRDQDKANGIKIVSVRLTAEEYGFLAKRAEAAGESPTSYLKNSALHNIAEKRHLSESELDILRDGLIQIRKVGANINQLAHHANAGFSVNQEETKYQLRYLESLIQQYFGRS